MMMYYRILHSKRKRKRKENLNKAIASMKKHHKAKARKQIINRKHGQNTWSYH